MQAQVGAHLRVRVLPWGGSLFRVRVDARVRAHSREGVDARVRVLDWVSAHAWARVQAGAGARQRVSGRLMV